MSGQGVELGLKADEVIFSDCADQAAISLRRSRSKEAASILRRVTYLEDHLLTDCQFGEVIPLPLPRTARTLEQRHAPLGNLYCADLPSFWRMLYTIVRDAGERYVYVLEIVDHADYGKWFPGRKKH